MTPQRCPFCDAPPEFRGLHYLRCPDVECAGHHWAAERKWNKRTISLADRALRNVMEAREVWVKSGDSAPLSVTLLILKNLLYPDTAVPEVQPTLDAGPVPIYGCTITAPKL